MNILGLTPARRSSVRVPGKNTMLLDGVPIVHYTAAAARNSRITHLLAVSNDPLFLRQASEAGALTLVEPDDLATATSRISDVLDWATTCFEHEHGPVESVVLLQPNCPQRPPGLIDELLDRLEAGFDVTASVARIPLKHHPYFAGRQDDQGAFFMFHPSALRSMLSGDFPPAYSVCGAGWAFRRECLRENRPWFEMNCGMVVVDDRTIEIDEPDDVRRVLEALQN